MNTNQRSNARWPIVISIPTLFVVIVRYLYKAVKPIIFLYSDDIWAVFLTYLSVFFICITSCIMAILLALVYIYCYINKLDNYQLVEMFGLNEDIVFHLICKLPIITIILVIPLEITRCSYEAVTDNDPWMCAYSFLLIIVIVFAIVFYYLYVRKKKRISKLSGKNWVFFMALYILVLAFVFIFIEIDYFNTDSVEILGEIHENGEINLDVNSGNELDEIEVGIIDAKSIKYNADDLFSSAASKQSKNAEYSITRFYNWEYSKTLYLEELINEKIEQDIIYYVQIKCRVNNRVYQYVISFRFDHGVYHQISKQEKIQFNS